HVEGTAATRYSGNRTIETELNSGNFRLRDYTRGNGILTYNANHAFFDANGSLNLNGATDFTDNNNNWTATEFNNANRDNAALDAHWGAEMTYDYFLQNHNRNSIDGSGYQLRNYVHVGTNWGNAAWDGQRMLYGDGNFTFNALTSIDVIGHEIGHGLDQNTSNLLYERESGAIDEG
ncbi:MAG: M4 family metallopeptidase, partial [Cyanobacteria bacterium]|nr:M4 family metallopeptidase [Cyanobacteria bacterium CG_2015-09_32_10]